MAEKQKIFAEERRGLILDEVNRSGSVTVTALVDLLGVSDMTIRRDLEALSAHKLLQKVHGGAVQIPKTSAEPHFTQKQRLNREEKKAIAQEALPLVEDGHTVAFSAGTTTWQIADALPQGDEDFT
ncbi:MAG: DeoR/GlpR family DNA-binding transcription regulator, partial [Rubrobacteraceae bacterium]